MAIDISLLLQFVGTIAVESYGVLILTQVIPDLALLIPLLLGVTGIVSSLIACALLFKVGRKTLVQIGTFFIIIFLGIIAGGFYQNSDDGNILVIVGLFLWRIALALSLSPIALLYISEIVEPSFNVIAVMVTFASAALVSILFPILRDAIGVGPIFIFFAVYTSIFFIINQIFMVETKGTTES